MEKQIVDLMPPIQVHHLSGGAVLWLGSDRTAALRSPAGMNAYCLRRGQSIVSLLRAYKKIRVLGRTTFQHPEEMHDPVTDNFVLPVLTKEHKCLAHDQQLYWRGAAIAAYQDGKGIESVVASRVASQVRICLRRIEQLSIAYRMTLDFAGTQPQRASPTLTNNKYAQAIGTEFRSILNELYALRDAVNSAVYRFKYGCSDGLRTKSLEKYVREDTSALGRLIHQSMFEPAGERLLDHMSLYRSVALHSLGMTNPVLGDGYFAAIENGILGPIMHVCFPLYDNIDRMREMEHAGSKGVLAPLPQDEAMRFVRKADHLDALEFCFDCFERILRIAEALAKEVALPSGPWHITDDDIQEVTITEVDGSVKRAKRDGLTGNLVEF
jgi:hypothetical protein